MPLFQEMVGSFLEVKDYKIKSGVGVMGQKTAIATLVLVPILYQVVWRTLTMLSTAT